MIPNYPYGIHMHCHGGGVEFTEKLLKAFPKIYFGFTGVITFPSAVQHTKVIQILPIENILLETDGPFMAPIPYRGLVAHSGMIPLVAKKIAEIKSLSIENVMKTTFENAKKLYGSFCFEKSTPEGTIKL
jgi:TatD DNase family protein